MKFCFPFGETEPLRYRDSPFAPLGLIGYRMCPLVIPSLKVVSLRAQQRLRNGL